MRPFRSPVVHGLVTAILLSGGGVALAAKPPGLLSVADLRPGADRLLFSAVQRRQSVADQVETTGADESVAPDEIVLQSSQLVTQAPLVKKRQDKFELDGYLLAPDQKPLVWIKSQPLRQGDRISPRKAQQFKVDDGKITVRLDGVTRVLTPKSSWSRSGSFLQVEDQ